MANGINRVILIGKQHSSGAPSHSVALVALLTGYSAIGDRCDRSQKANSWEDQH